MDLFKIVLKQVTKASKDPCLVEEALSRNLEQKQTVFNLPQKFKSKLQYHKNLASRQCKNFHSFFK